MTKVKLTISIDSEIAKDLRARSIEKYGNSRSFSQIIEDLATGSAEPAPPACRLGLMSDRAKLSQERFNEAVEFVSKQLDSVKIPTTVWGREGKYETLADYHSYPDPYYILKEAMELRLNQMTKSICWQCLDLDGPLPTYPDAGRNFELLYLKFPECR